MSLRNRLYEKLSGLRNISILSPEKGPLASPMLTLLLPDKYEKTAVVKMLFDKHKLSIRATHKEFGFNGIRFSCHIFNSENEIDLAAKLIRQELI